MNSKENRLVIETIIKLFKVMLISGMSNTAGSLTWNFEKQGFVNIFLAHAGLVDLLKLAVEGSRCTA